MSSCYRKKRETLQACDRGRDRFKTVFQEGSSVWCSEVKGQRQPKLEPVKESDLQVRRGRAREQEAVLGSWELE